MKLNAALAKSLLMAASVGIVVPLLADTTVTPTPPSTTPAKPPAKTAPAKPTKPGTVKPKPTPAPKSETPEEIQLPGLVQPRPKGGFVTIEVASGKLKVSFYDAKKKQVLADVPRASARWKTNKKISEDHTVLSPDGDGKSLISAGYVKPPFAFRLYLSLLNEDGTAAENYTVDMGSLTSG